jgi:hypothetical protein
MTTIVNDPPHHAECSILAVSGWSNLHPPLVPDMPDNDLYKEEAAMTDYPTGPDGIGESEDAATEALDALRQVTITLSFDRDDPVSIEAAIRDFDAQIDAVVAPFRGNAFIEEVARQIKSECRDSLLQRIAELDADDPGRTLH